MQLIPNPSKQQIIYDRFSSKIIDLPTKIHVKVKKNKQSLE